MRSGVTLFRRLRAISHFCHGRGHKYPPLGIYILLKTHVLTVALFQVSAAAPPPRRVRNPLLKSSHPPPLHPGPRLGPAHGSRPTPRPLPHPTPTPTKGAVRLEPAFFFFAFAHDSRQTARATFIWGKPDPSASHDITLTTNWNHTIVADMPFRKRLCSFSASATFS